MSSPTNYEASPTSDNTTPVLRAVGIVKCFGDNVVLRGLDLDVAAHEVVVLLGASGSGKSTLLRCANLLERVDDGQIFLAGEDITDPRANADQIRARIGVVFQHYNLFPHMSVLDNVTLAARKVHGWEKERAHERGMELLDRIGLKDKAKEYPDRLSGGQQQRVAIARPPATTPAGQVVETGKGLTFALGDDARRHGRPDAAQGLQLLGRGTVGVDGRVDSGGCVGETLQVGSVALSENLHVARNARLDGIRNVSGHHHGGWRSIRGQVRRPCRSTACEQPRKQQQKRLEDGNEPGKTARG